MSVIGYDGRLRPASRALQVGAPNEFNPEHVARIGEAQPKLAELAIDLFDSLAGNANKYGNALAAKEKRLEAIKADEHMMAAKEKTQEIKREVELDDNIPEGQKAGEFKSRAEAEIAPFQTNDEELRRQSALKLRAQTFNYFRSIQAESDRIAEYTKNAEYEGGLALRQQQAIAALSEKLPSITSSAKNLGEVSTKITSEWATLFGENNGVNETQKLAFDNTSRAGLLSLLGTGSKSFLDQEKAKGIEGINLRASAAVDAPDTVTAMSVAKEIYDRADAQALLTPVQRGSAVSATALANAEKLANDAMRELNTVKDAKIKAASVHLANGKRDAYNQVIAGANADISAGYDKIVAELESSKLVSARYIGNLDYLSGEEREALQTKSDAKFDDMIEQVIQKKVNALEVLKKQTASAKQEVGRSVHKEVQDFYTKSTSPTTQLAFDRLKASAPPAKDVDDSAWESLKSRYNVTSGSDETALVYARANFSGLSDSEAIEATVQSFIYEIAVLDVGAGGYEDQTRVMEILMSAVSVLGEKSDGYARVAKFARDNAVKENRNSYNKGEFLSRALGTDWEKKEKNLTAEELTLITELTMGLKEIPRGEKDSEYYKALDNAVLHFKKEKAYFRVGGLSEVKEDVERMKRAQTSSGVSPFDSKQPESNEVTRLLSGEKRVKDAFVQRALESGASPRFAIAQSAWADGPYWLDEAKKRNIKVWSNNPSEAKRLVLKFEEKKAAQEKADEAKRKKAKQDEKDMPGLLKWLSDKNLPKNRSAYTSFWGFGGLPINSSDELELGVNWDSHEELTADEIRSLKSQFEFFERAKQEALKKYK